MLPRLFSYPYGNVRARALAAGLLREPQFAELISAPSRSQAERFLAKLPGFSGGLAESALYADYMSFGMKIARALPAIGGQLVAAYLKRSQIENLKLLCRAILTGRRELVEPGLLPEGPDKFVTEEMLAARSLEELAARLPPGDFRDLLRAALPVASEERLFFLDAALESLFWTRLGEQVLALPAMDRSAAREILAMRADVDRFRVIGRGLHAGLPAETILSALPPFGTLLPCGKVRRALLSADPASACQQLRTAAMRGPGTDRDSEVFLLQRLYRRLQKTLRGAPFAVSVALSALLLKELELRDLLLVTSGLRLGAERKELATLLSCRGG
jgi:vacuolar-type H+-ATPase subunit C/Vma6